MHGCGNFRDVRPTRIRVNACFEFAWGGEKKKKARERVNRKELASERDFVCVCACFLTDNTSSAA